MMNSESTLSDALSEVDTALAASDNERAAGLASELLLAYPNAVSVLRQRARALAASGRSLQAAEVHRRVLEILPADGDAMAGLARTLHTAGQTTEAREAARQALDYLPGDQSLMPIAAGEGQSYFPDDSSMLLRKSLAQTQVGMMHQGIAGLRAVVANCPDRVDARVALMQAQWRHGERISAAEQAQAVLDDYPNCLPAHVLLLVMWRSAGVTSMERVHQLALEEVDPDHRVMHAMLGTQSPLPVIDVPARPVAPIEPTYIDEDPMAREDWVDNLVAAASASPKPLEQREPEAGASNPLIDDLAVEAESEQPDEGNDFVSALLPLEWAAASDLSEESAQEDFTVSWIEGDVKNEFTPSRLPAATPDPRDGVPEAIEPLEWETERQDEAATAARKDFSTTVDGGTAHHDEAPANSTPAVTDTPPENKPLSTFAAALALATAKRASQTPAESGSPPQAEASASAPIQAEVASASVKPMPIDAVEFVDETGDSSDAADTRIDEAEFSAATPTQPVNAVASEASATTPEAPVTEATQTPAAKVEAPADEATQQKGSMVQAVAAATALSAASKKRKKRAVEEMTPAAPPTVEETPTLAAENTEVAGIEAEAPQAVAAEAAPEVVPAASKAAKPKRAKKPAAKPTPREAQTEKVRKTYERAIATAKREEMPKLITELSQAAEVDPDNKIIFELLGQAYNRQGDISAAINAYRRALELADHA